MREDTALFIITHERVDSQRTLKTLDRGGYQGDIFLVVDDEDKELAKYKQKYGDKVLVFSKQEYWKKTDTYTNEYNLKACVYARNACADFARQMGYKYFFVCDDDITSVNYKTPKGKKMITTRAWNLDTLLEWLVNWIEGTAIKAIGISEDGAFIGGINQDVRNGIKYMMSKFMLFRADDPLVYKGLVFEDTVTVFDALKKGQLCFSFMGASQSTPPNNTSKGGCSDLYATSTTWTNYFYVVMCRPDTVKMTIRKGDWNMKRNNEALVPKILNERWKKHA